jgi:hypothetical protein
MSRKLRSRKVDEDEVEQVFDRMVKGMRNEMNTVMWKIERSRDVSPEALRNMFKNGLDAVVGAMEKVMYGVSDGLAKERKEKEQTEEAKKLVLERENERREERMRAEEERVRKLEEKMERVARENEERWKEREERFRIMEERMEREAIRRGGEERSKERTKNMDEEVGNNEKEEIKERIKVLEEKMKVGGKILGQDASEVHVRVSKLETSMAKDKAERQEYELDMEEEKEIQDAKDSEKEMEKKLEAAMEQLKILNLDFGGECKDRRTMITEAISRIKENVIDNDQEEYDRIMKGTRVDILGKRTCVKETRKGSIHTVPVLLTCGCRNVKERLEAIVRNAGLVASVQWPKECMEFVDKIREKVEIMGFGKMEYYTRVRPVLVEGRILLRADLKRKEGGKFVRLAFWRAPPRDKEHWKRIINMVEPEWRMDK